MCGIAGIVNWREDLSPRNGIISDMLGKMTARGPDGEDIYKGARALLGQRRLGGARVSLPVTMKHNGETFVIICNSNIYNSDELRAKLKDDFLFRSETDAEVLLAAYLKWGEEFLHRLDGVFAAAIWNETKETLFLARDRLGIKPLFYAERGENFIFGSELKALLAHPAVLPQIDAAGLAEIFMMGPARTPGNGVFKDVHELKPGHILFADKNKISIKKYWSFTARPHTDDFSATSQNVRELFQNIVKSQLKTDRPLCCLLSGGLDSSIITGIAANFYQDNGLDQLNTYSVNYVDNDKFFIANNFQLSPDEPWAQKVSKHFRTNHHTIMIDTPELADTLENAVLARDLPGMADVDSSLYLLCREIKKNAAVVLSGECADEVFGGYPWFHRAEMLEAKTFPWSMSAAIRTGWLAEDVKQKIRPMEYLAARYEEAMAEVPRLNGENAQDTRMRELSYLTQTRFMPTLVDRKDRMSIASSLEARVPFSNHQLAEYLFNVPWEMKCYNQREKGLLRHAFTGLLPDDILWRKKSPYPKTHNPNYTTNVVKKALAIFDKGTSPLLPLINVEKLRQIAGQDLSAANIPWFGQLMSGPQLFAYLVQVDFWMREYKIEIV